MRSVLKNMLCRMSPCSRALKRRSRLYRRLHACAYGLRDVLFPKESYSQWGEDRLIWDWLRGHGGIRRQWVYIDVGTNHPTVINDTYLFYRNGYRGICIEPNHELAEVVRLFRPRDWVMNVAAGNKSGVFEFYVTENPVFSSLVQDKLEDRLAQAYPVPIIRLDDLLPYLRSSRVFLLKIDTEGFDQQVLEGATTLLRSTMLVQTETRSEAEREMQSCVLGSDWRVIYAGANTVFVNTALGAT